MSVYFKKPETMTGYPPNDHLRRYCDVMFPVIQVTKLNVSSCGITENAYTDLLSMTKDNPFLFLLDERGLERLVRVSDIYHYTGHLSKEKRFVINVQDADSIEVLELLHKLFQQS